MAQIPEIPAFAYTPEMETLGVIPDIPVFECDRIPVSRNALTSGTQPLQFLPAPGSDFPIRYNSDAMRCFQDASRSCSLEEQFRDVAASQGIQLLALFDSMGGRCLDSLCPSSPSAGPYPVQSLTSGLLGGPYYLGERVLEICTTTAQRRVPVAPPRHMCTLDGMTPEDRLLEYGGFPTDDYLVPGDYASYLSIRLKTRLPDVREYSQTSLTYARIGRGIGLLLPMRRRQRLALLPGLRLSCWVPFPPGMEVTLDPTLGLGPTLAIPADLRQAPPQLQLDPEHATHVPAQRYQEIYQRFCFARTYIARLYPERHEMMENDRLRTRLEGVGVPLDFTDEEEEDDDDSSSDNASPLPPSCAGQAAAGPSRMQR
ncbi:hypothetical protein JCGZ_06974 [Jatropha curcas]|uniref:Aminotransferase-like plant mobile domain-containing protein n=1 Tax=Jatropha curcas TaxID=180498 RepID=A0A067JC51_JATCU|nr:hypothetical protein JCGZ_06974 [Jatropha curcas]